MRGRALVLVPLALGLRLGIVLQAPLTVYSPAIAAEYGWVEEAPGVRVDLLVRFVWTLDGMERSRVWS